MVDTACPVCGSTKVRPQPPTPGSRVTWYFCPYCSQLFDKPHVALTATKQPDAR